MLCISVSYKKTTDKLRQHFSFSADEQKEFLGRLIHDGIISGGVVLSTCNRNELYVTVNCNETVNDDVTTDCNKTANDNVTTNCKVNDDAANHNEYEADKIGFWENGEVRSLKQIEEAFSEYKGLSHNEILKNCLFYQGERAVRHLYKVVCGLDSMVLGEDEILHQTKDAYQLSKSIGATDAELNILFQGAFNCARLTKSETHISETPVSIGTLTANYVEEYIRKQAVTENVDAGVQGDDREQEDDIWSADDRELADDKELSDDTCSVMVIGASGQIGSIVAKDLIDKGISVIGTSRSHPSSDNLWQSDEMTWIDFAKRYDYLSGVSAIVSATKSPHYTLTKDEFCVARQEEHTMLLVDLAIPYDIDRDIESEEGVKLIGIDHFKELSEKNSALKHSEAKKMETIVSECVEDVLKRLYIRNFQALMPEQEKWFSKMIFYLKDSLDSDTLLKVLSKIYNHS